MFDTVEAEDMEEASSRKRSAPRREVVLPWTERSALTTPSRSTSCDLVPIMTPQTWRSTTRFAAARIAMMASAPAGLMARRIHLSHTRPSP